MPHKSKVTRNHYNRIYQRNNPALDFYSQLAEMGKPLQVVRLSLDNGHVCHELPVCHKRAAWALLWMDEEVILCVDGYKRLQEMK